MLELVAAIPSAYGFVVILIGSIVAAATWVHRQTKAIAKSVAREVSDGVEDNVAANRVRIEALELDLNHHKQNAKQETLAIKKRFDKIDETLQALSVSYTKATMDLEHFIELNRVENQMKKDALTRIESNQKDMAAVHRQWVDQIATSLREVTQRAPKE